MGLKDLLQSFLPKPKVDVSMRFELLSEGFLGTMSRYHKARDREHDDRVIGLKVCDLEKTTFFESRFKGLNKPTEGEIAMSIHHPRIVETLERGQTTKGENYIVMEFLDGTGLNLLINKKEPKLIGHRVSLVRQMAEAVHGVHQAGYIHRDVCPRNFICSPDFTKVTLIDFGLTVPDKPDFRQPGNRTGTPMYLAPEIVRRRSTDKRVDIFAFGVSAYELLTFSRPWPHAEHTGKGALAHDTEPPIPILEVRPNLDKTLAEAVMACIAASRDHRPPTLDNFLQRIRKVPEEGAE